MAYRRAALLAEPAGSTSGSRGPSGRTPTWRCGWSGAGCRIVPRRRRVTVTRCGRRGWWLSLRRAARQRRRRADAPAARAGAGAAGRRAPLGPAVPQHLLTPLAGLAAALHRRWSPVGAAAGALAGAAAGSPVTAEFAAAPDRARARGRRPRSPRMLGHQRGDPAGRRGWLAARRLRWHAARLADADRGQPSPARARCCFDRDGTLVARRPLQRRPRRWSSRCPAPGRRSTGCGPPGSPLGVVSNQSGIGPRPDHRRRRWTRSTRGSSELLGPVRHLAGLPARPTTDGCACRKPAPGMVTGGRRDARRRPSRVRR